MGILMSFMGGKVATTQVTSMFIGSFIDQFMKKDIKDFEDFHVAILDLFNAINMALPGKHYDAPPFDEIEGLFKKWRVTHEQKARKELFTDFMVKNVNLRKVDRSMMVTGIVAPPAAMAAKRTGQILPQLKVMKAVPDVVFVPSATVLALVTVKLYSRIFTGKIRDDRSDAKKDTTAGTEVDKKGPSTSRTKEGTSTSDAKDTTAEKKDKKEGTSTPSSDASTDT